MSADELLSALRALRQEQRDANYWSLVAVCLMNLCRASGALVLQPQSEERWGVVGSTSPATVPWLSQTTAWLHALGERAMRNGHAYQPDEQWGFICVVRMLEPATPTLVLMRIDGKERAQIKELMLRAQLIADLPQGAGIVASAADKSSSSDLLGLLDLNAKVMREDTFGAAVLTLVNGLAAHGDLEQVSLGWLEPSGYVRMQAVSHLDRFERKMETVSLLESAMEEAVDQRTDVYYPSPVESETVTLAHERLQRVLGQQCLATLVLSNSAETETAVLMLTRSGAAFNASELSEMSVAMHLLLPWLVDCKARSRNAWQRFYHRLKSTLRHWMSPEKPGKKLLWGSALVAVLFVVFGTWPHRIEAGAELVTDSTQIISSPFDGYLASVYVSLGDAVEQGQRLASLDTRDLVLQIADYQSETNRFLAEADRARALNEGANTEIARARAAQARAKYERAKFQLEQATVQAPFSGIVVEGERKELTGMPVKQGDPVVKLARIEGLYGLLSVSERDVHFLPEHATGNIRLLSAPDQEIPFEIMTLVPTAQVKGQAGNQFMMKVKLLQAPQAWWRPGMSGLALIEAGDRNVFWLISHRLFDFLRLKLWW